MLMIKNPIVFSVGKRRLSLNIGEESSQMQTSIATTLVNKSKPPLYSNQPTTPRGPKNRHPMSIPQLYTIGGNNLTMEGGAVIGKVRLPTSLINTLDIIDHHMGGRVTKVTTTKITTTLREHLYIHTTHSQFSEKNILERLTIHIILI